jgi:ribose transport system permease protein
MTVNVEHGGRAGAQSAWSARNILGGVWRSSALYRPVLLLVIALIVIFSVTLPTFRTSDNIQNTLTNSAGLWVVAMGMTFVCLSGGIDISVGALMALNGVFLAKLTSAGLSQWPALVALIVFSTAVGAIANGLLIGRFKLSFFIVTLATMTAITGVVNVWSGSSSIPVESDFVNGIAVNELLGVQIPIWIMAITLVIALYVQRYTYLGRDIYAVGGNLQAARLSGIRTIRTIVIVYGLMGLTAAIAAMVSVSQIGVASATVDNNLALSAIAAVVLGGTAFGGGGGGVQGTVFGVLFLGILSNGLDLAGVPGAWQQVATGVILIAALLEYKTGAGIVPGRRRRGGGGGATGSRGGAREDPSANLDAGTPAPAAETPLTAANLARTTGPGLR